jgi:transposase
VGCSALIEQRLSHLPSNERKGLPLCVHFQSPFERGSLVANVTTCGIDLAKAVFSLHAVIGASGVVLRKTVGRARLMALIAHLPPA